MKPVTFLKLGGSLITDKSKPYTARPAVLARLAREIQIARKAHPGNLLVIGNGVGSFSHYAAQQYNYPLDPRNPQFAEGFATIHHASVSINKLVVDALLKAGVPAFSVHPSSFFVSERAAKKSILVEQTLGMLQAHIVPVVYGDIVFDTVKGAVIYSTERVFEVMIAEFLRQEIPVRTIIQATVVPGVLDSHKKVIKQVTEASFGDIKKMLYTTGGFDVTGGMLHKLEQSLKYARQGIVTRIISGRKATLVQQALMEHGTEGTTIS